MSERASRKTQYSSAVALTRVLATPSSSPVERRTPIAPARHWRQAVQVTAKHALDVTLALWALLCLSPLFLVVAILIKIDSPGPVIFRQYRIGRHGGRFQIYKFRTMCVMENGSDIAQARRGDPRVTRVGRLLRRSSIDELPQLFNVLRGDMSIVGPRPHAVSHDIYYGALIPEYADRRVVKPGITGWAQVNGVRGETATVGEMQRRVTLDLWYIDNWSLALDLRIAWRTCFEVIRWDAY
jgi:exopolysaccharide biosynthesis polyprenyl glycosylphosphotransferase